MVPVFCVAEGGVLRTVGGLEALWAGGVAEAESGEAGERLVDGVVGTDAEDVVAVDAEDASGIEQDGAVVLKTGVTGTELIDH